MKIPTARQLPSGSWFVQLRVNGKSISITRETKDAAIAEALAVKNGIIKARKNPEKKKLTSAIDDYIASRSNILSPSTIRGYRFIQKGRFQSMMQRDIGSITQEQWKRAINAEAKLCSPKTLKNAWGFISSVILETTGEHIAVTLPQVPPNEHPYLTPEQIKIFVAAVKGTTIEIPALLALSSLRRSELLALRWDQVDLNAGVLHVSGSAVYDEDSQLVHKKANKNKTSTRTVPIIPPLKEALQAAEQKGEYVCACSPAGLFQHINRICIANGLPKVGIHGLRHSFASLAYSLGIPEKYAMEIGGWSNDQTMKKIYTHVSRQDITSHAAAFSSFFTNNAPDDGLSK